MHLRLFSASTVTLPIPHSKLAPSLLPYDHTLISLVLINTQKNPTSPNPSITKMNQTMKIHSESNMSSVPFNWEKQPGVSKPMINSKDQIFFHENQEFTANLPLPPSRLHPNSSSLRSSSMKGLAKQSSFEEDPFLVALLECTKTKPSTPIRSRLESRRSGLIMIKKSLSKFGCKKSCGVRDDALIKNQVLASYE